MVGETAKIAWTLVFIVATLIALICIFHDRPDDLTRQVLAVSSIVVAIAAIALLKRIFRVDLLPDYLSSMHKEFFNQGGFCFSIEAQARDGICHFVTHYQNQYLRPCIGRIALRPAPGFFLNRSNICSVTFEVQCDAGAFGIVSAPIAIPKEVQGKRESFELGVSVDYPNGRGKRVRFREGLVVHRDSTFRNSVGTTITVLNALIGQIEWRSPDRLTLALPNDVTEELPPSAITTSRTLWRDGDPEFLIDSRVS